MSKRLNKKSLYTIFIEEVCRRTREIDPDGEQDWFSLSIGWAIAKGYSPAQSHTFAIYARYDRLYKE